MTSHSKNRPYFKSRIKELERLFAESQSNLAVLERLRQELEHRSTQRAQRLRSKVEQALRARRKASSSQPRPVCDDNRDRSPRDERATHERNEPGVGSSVTTKTASSADLNERGDPSRLQALLEPAPQWAHGQTVEPGPRVEVHTPVDRRTNAAPDRILSAWTTLEVLSPQPLPTVEDYKALGRPALRHEEDPEPWNSPRSRRRGRERAVYWFLHLGLVDLAKATASLVQLFPQDDDDEPPSAKGETTMAVVVLDWSGRLVEGKTVLSSFPWGYGKLRDGALSDLIEFPEAQRTLCSEIERRLVRQNEDGEILPISGSDVRRVTRWLGRALNLPTAEVVSTGLAVRVPVWGFVGDGPDPELLNSFFLDDLVRIRHALRAGDAGAAAKIFLSGIPTQPRQDAVRDKELIERTLSPTRMPLARWPVAGRYPLVLMQQAAVNHSVRELQTDGLLGINGPPGTGKTTLLRDVIAKIVLDRATCLAEFDEPLAAFSHVGQMRTGSAYTHLYSLDDSLLGHEIVVASSNNNAVENISREIPTIDAVTDELVPPLRYLSSIADCVAAGGRDDEIVDGASWGLAAAVLGKAANKAAFAKSFWWHQERGLATYLWGVSRGWGPDAEGDQDAAEVLFRENAPRDEAEARDRWQAARATFRSKRERVEAFLKELEVVRAAIARVAPTQERLNEVQTEVDSAKALHHDLQQELARISDRHSAAGSREERLRSDRQALHNLRPGLFARWFRTRSYRDWLERARTLEQALAAAQTVFVQLDQQLDRTRAAEDELGSRLRRLVSERSRQRETLQEMHAAIDAGRAELGTQLPDGDLWGLEDDDLQRRSPWIHEGLQRAREELFAACFALHRAFIDAAAKRLRHNLRGALELLKVRRLTEAQEPARKSLWASLFLVVPVISTTFASVARLFGPLGREQIGWLLIDEAGQAEPQAAMGAIWRSERVLAIGDPLQIPPVVTTPDRLKAAIFHEYAVPVDEWSGPHASVQSLADSASWFGTNLYLEEGDCWVGSPLRVHRRCQEPMFSISNRVAYSSLMVQATTPGPSRIGEVLGESRWFDVESDAVGKWSDAEGEVAVRILERLLDAGVQDPDIYFITPFRVVMHGLRQRIGAPSSVGPRLPGKPWDWCQERVGTIHVFQGKEAEAVVVVLGAPLDESAGARRWAGSTPNLLNVAVSRAKKRLYVVGSHRVWKSVRHFSKLAESLRLIDVGPDLG